MQIPPRQQCQSAMNNLRSKTGSLVYKCPADSSTVTAGWLGSEEDRLEAPTVLTCNRRRDGGGEGRGVAATAVGPLRKAF